jgi:hypothetical protein
MTPRRVFRFTSKLKDGAKLGRKHLCKILYKASSFGSIRPTNMAAVTKNRTYGKIARFWTKSIKILMKKGNNSKIGNQIFFKI